jgi:hypothetical protein
MGRRQVTFVSAFRRAPQWDLVDPLRDGRACPQCRATIHGREARRDHTADHVERKEFDSRVLAALEKISRHVGLGVRVVADEGLYDGAGELERVGGGQEDDDDDG